jgi:5-methylcytosine-specific restriction endonuclease McrA
MATPEDVVSSAATRGERETVEIPKDLRAAVDERDGGFCRMCGKFLGERRAIHHIYYGGDLQGMGGRRRHELDNLISLCWIPGDMGCHERAHSNKSFWQPLLHAAITQQSKVTAFQLARWSKKEKS